MKPQLVYEVKVMMALMVEREEKFPVYLPKSFCENVKHEGREKNTDKTG